MKVLITASGSSLNSPVDQRFGRAPFFIIIDTENENNPEIYQNPFSQAPSSSGISAAQFAIEKGVQAVVSGAFGPNASMVLSGAGISMLNEPEPIPVKEALIKLKEKKYSQETQQFQQPPVFGGGYGFGGGWGRGFGWRRWNQLQWHPFYQVQFSPPYQPPFYSFNEKMWLKTAISSLEAQLKILKERLSQIEKSKEER